MNNFVTKNVPFDENQNIFLLIQSKINVTTYGSCQCYIVKFVSFSYKYYHISQPKYFQCNKSKT